MVSIHISDWIAKVIQDWDVSIQDREYILRRFKSEGINFLTVQLPTFSKHVVASLESGDFQSGDSALFVRENFGRKKCLSRFFWYELIQVFHENGKLRSNADPVAILQIRSVCEYFYKLALPYTGEQLETAKTNFLKNEEELKALSEDGWFDTPFVDRLRKDFILYWQPLCTSIDKVFSSFGPRDTSGSFIGGGSDSFYMRGTAYFRSAVPRRAGGHLGFYPRGRIATHRVNLRHSLVDEPSFSELLFVAKDSRGPRSICREHPHRLRTQMAFFDWATQNMNRLSQGAINFLDQGVNRRLAETSSVDEKFSTIDLKDASDRVSARLMKKVCSGSSAISTFLRDHRASFVSIPNGPCQLFSIYVRQVLCKTNLLGNRCLLASMVYLQRYTNQTSKKFLLQKTAGMGSGLTFPLMSLLISLAISREVVNKGLANDYNIARSRIFIYGDDIIVPRKWYDSAITALSKVGLRANTSKSFTKGHFRESCGGDYFNGNDVTPVRARFANSGPTIKGKNIVLMDGHSSVNQLYKHVKNCYLAGMHHTARYLLSVLRKIKGITIVPGRISENNPYMVDPYRGTAHYNPNHQVVAMLPVSVSVPIGADHDVFKDLKQGNLFKRNKTLRPIDLIAYGNALCSSLALGIRPPSFTVVEYTTERFESPDEIRERALSVLYPKDRSNEVISKPHEVKLISRHIPAWLIS